MTWKRGLLPVMTAIAATVAAAPPAAGAATTVGKTFTPDESCLVNTTFLMSGVPGFTVPSDGVITSWSFQAPATFVPSAIKLKMARPAGGNDFTIVGESDPESPAVSQLNSFPTRIPVLAGDIVGLHTASPDLRFCGHTLVSTTYHRLQNADPPPGTTATFMPDADFEIDTAAGLEPDADRDGFGDETQDNCLGLANPGQGDGDGDGLGTACDDEVSPNTLITSKPKDKTKKKQATFTFTGTDARAVASFECSLDGGVFTTCTSPYTVKVKKGKHTFAVEAIDQAGNVGAPATDTWKRKRKKK